MSSRRFTLRELSPILFILISAAVSQMALRHAERAKSDRLALPIVVPNRALALTAALGYEAFAADMLWLHALEYFGDNRYAQGGYPALVPLFVRITDIDDRFCAVYRQAGLALTINEVKRVDVANDLLRRGTEMCPDDAYIPFILGFNLYFFQRKYEEASLALFEAAGRPGAPPWVGELASRVAGSVEDLYAMELLLSAMVDAQTDERARDQMERRLLRVQTEQALRKVDEALRQAKAAGKDASSVAALVRQGFLAEAPKDPSGGQIVIKDGEAATTKYKDRLRLEQNDVFREVWE
ncbi:MAG: hypothetical protein IT381_25505 [Deltaproteobacteria bacterium]|nr:hypothetical protein [Deltaproteobacteria bacterium]